MAQDVIKHFPKFKDQLTKVEPNDEINDALLLNESKLIYILWLGLQEQIKINKDLEGRIIKLEGGN
jgi:hypothetical protein